MWRKTAVYVDKILKGRTRQSCQSWNLAKSQNSRAALGLTFPDTVLAHADKVIEWERVGTGLRHHHESVRYSTLAYVEKVRPQLLSLRHPPSCPARTHG